MAAIKTLEKSSDPVVRLAVTGKVMATIRQHLISIRGGELRLAALDTSLAMEIEHYTAGRELVERLQAANSWVHGVAPS